MLNLPSTQWQNRLFFLLLLIVAFFVRLPNLNESLWYDEITYTFIGLSSASIKGVLLHDVHPFLYPLFMRGWIGLFGDSEIAVRLPSLLFGLASLGLTFFLARNWFNRKIAFLSTVLVALSPVHIWYSQEAKNNMLLLLLTLLSMYQLQRAWSDDRWHHWLLFMVTTVMALWTNYFSMLVAFSAFLWLWLQILKKQSRTRLKWAVISSAFVVMAYFPVALSALLQIDNLGRGYLRPFTLGEVYKLLLIYLSHGNTLRTISPYAPFSALGTQPWGFFLIEGFFIFLLGSGLWIVARSWVLPRGKPPGNPFSGNAECELLLFYFFIPQIALLLASRFYPKIYIERSMIILLPPHIILLACGVFAPYLPRWRSILMTTLLFLNCWALFNLWIAKADTWTVYKQNPNWRAAAQYFDDQRSRSSEKFLIVDAIPSTELIYYYPKLVKIVPPRKERADTFPSRLPVYHLGEFKMTKFINLLHRKDINIVYLLNNRFWGGGFEKLLKAVDKDSRFQFLNKASFKGIDIFKFRVLSLRSGFQNESGTKARRSVQN